MVGGVSSRGANVSKSAGISAAMIENRVLAAQRREWGAFVAGMAAILGGSQA